MVRKYSRRRRFRRSALGALLCLGLLPALASQALAASPVPEASGSTSDAPALLRVGWTSSPDTLNPLVTYSSASWEVFRLNYDQLFDYNPDLSPRLSLASELPTKANGGLSADGKTITVKLREGVTWQDGVPFTSADVAWTYNFIIENQNANFSPFTAGIKPPVESPDENTVVFHLDAPKANFLRMPVPILPEHIWGKLPPAKAQSSYQNKPPIVGTGPFQVTEFKKDGFAKLAKSPTYWGAKPALDEIIFQVYTNADTMGTDLRMGTIDLARAVPPATYEQLSDEPSIEVTAGKSLTFSYLGINCYDNDASLGDPALRDVQVRQALNYAIDREKLVALADYGYADLGSSTIAPQSKFGDIDYHWTPPADQVYGYDPVKADEMLTAAGYGLVDGVRVDDKGKPLKLRLWASNTYASFSIAGKLIAGWLEDLGIKIEFSALDTGTMYDGIYNYDGKTFAPDFDLFLTGWVSYLDPGDNLGSWTTDQIEIGWNETGWSNEDFDRLFPLQNAAVNPETGGPDSVERRDMVWQMQQLMYEESPYIVYSYPQNLTAYNVAKWEGWVKDSGGNVAFTNFNMDSYLKVHPATAGITQASDSGSQSWLIPAVLVAAVVIVAAIVLIRRRSGRAVEEA